MVGRVVGRGRREEEEEEEEEEREIREEERGKEGCVLNVLYVL